MSGSISCLEAVRSACVSESRSTFTFVTSFCTSGLRSRERARAGGRAPLPVCAMPAASLREAGAACFAPAASWSEPAASWSIPVASWLAPSAPAASPFAQLLRAVRRAAQAAFELREQRPLPERLRRQAAQLARSAAAAPPGRAPPRRPATGSRARWKSSIACSRSVVVIGPRVWKSTSNGAAQPAPRSRWKRS